MKRTATLALAILLSFASASAMAGDRYDRRPFFEPDRRAGHIHDWRSRQERRDGDERRNWHERFGRYELQDRRRVVLWPRYDNDRRQDDRDSHRRYRHPDYWR